MTLSRFRAILFALAFSIGLAAAPDAAAHAHLVKAVPAADMTVANPARIELTFNEALVPRASRVTVIKTASGATQSKVDRLQVELVNDGKTLRATPHQPLGAGIYRVEWRAVGPDGHPMTGAYQFTVK